MTGSKASQKWQVIFILISQLLFILLPFKHDLPLLFHLPNFAPIWKPNQNAQILNEVFTDQFSSR